MSHWSTNVSALSEVSAATVAAAIAPWLASLETLAGPRPRSIALMATRGAASPAAGLAPAEHTQEHLTPLHLANTTHSGGLGS